MDKAGIETSFRDTTVRPQDDFYRRVNGKWLKTAEIPADRSSAGAFMDCAKRLFRACTH
jgi:endothelin-converting enzyme/putative endopeptidase